jgi:hypothetical protein
MSSYTSFILFVDNDVQAANYFVYAVKVFFYPVFFNLLCLVLLPYVVTFMPSVDFDIMS